jgi:hypothetical protein
VARRHTGAPSNKDGRGRIPLRVLVVRRLGATALTSDGNLSEWSLSSRIDGLRARSPARQLWVRGRSVWNGRLYIHYHPKSSKEPKETSNMSVTTEKSAYEPAIRPFTIEVPDAELEALRARIAATHWPEKETVGDQSQGPPLATMQALARYWAEEYDWRKCEEKLNGLPKFITEIDGLDIHFIHVRSEEKDALPLIVTHGWPGSVIEQLKIVEPLTDPTAHGRSASDAFHLVIPSMPGYGYSGKPTTTGWDPGRIARAWTVLMKRLAYKRFVAQGGDWGGLVVDQMGSKPPRN